MCVATTNTITVPWSHLYQGRFKSFPVAEDDSFLALCRYVEANRDARAGGAAEQWPWSGLGPSSHTSSLDSSSKRRP